MEDVCLFYGQLVYVKTIWSILWPFGTFYDHLVHFMYIWSFGNFSPFWYAASRNSGNHDYILNFISCLGNVCLALRPIINLATTLTPGAELSPGGEVIPRG
jgi:hypothetical protein